MAGDCCGAEDVLNLLRFGAPLPDSPVEASTIAPFLPALAVAAHDSAAVDPRLLAALASHPYTPLAFAYANLDCGAPFVSRIRETLAAATTSAGTEQQDLWSDEDAGELDECDAFQQGDEVMRVNCKIFAEFRPVRK